MEVSGLEFVPARPSIPSTDIFYQQHTIRTLPSSGSSGALNICSKINGNELLFIKAKDETSQEPTFYHPAYLNDLQLNLS